MPNYLNLIDALKAKPELFWGLLALIVSVIVLLLLSYYVLSSRKKTEQPGEKRDELATEAEERASLPQDIEEIRHLNSQAWLQRLRNGLSKTRDSLRSHFETLLNSKANLDADTLDSIHEILYRSDIGVRTTEKLISHVNKTLKESSVLTWEQIRDILSQEAEKILSITPNTATAAENEPLVILVVGVNGVGKTTTIGKLAAHFLAENHSVMLCAADTYRAAAIDQLKIWGDRLGVKVIAHQEGSDPAAVAFDAIKAAKARGTQILLIDTAGRLHNKQYLMDELGKIKRVISREIPNAPHETFLVIDATTGQNAFLQVRAFKEVVNLSGICVTKLDGTAKGGVIIGLSDEFQVPIRYIGVGEKAADLRQFNAKEFVDSMLS
ncbi:MAG: signal recognition particle-docking protein FtsY [Deltaproteobacteria bacterium]|nr:signal recognition particle-docking protein FtsY [Deltaproteobacteria bacterium]